MSCCFLVGEMRSTSRVLIDLGAGRRLTAVVERHKAENAVKSASVTLRRPKKLRQGRLATATRGKAVGVGGAAAQAEETRSAFAVGARARTPVYMFPTRPPPNPVIIGA